MIDPGLAAVAVNVGIGVMVLLLAGAWLAALAVLRELANRVDAALARRLDALDETATDD